ADDDGLQRRRQVEPTSFEVNDDFVPVRRGQVEDGYAVSSALVEQRRRRGGCFRAAQDQGACAGQRRVNFLTGGVERQRRELIENTMIGQAVGRARGLHERVDGGVAHGHALRAPRRSGGE